MKSPRQSSRHVSNGPTTRLTIAALLKPDDAEETAMFEVELHCRSSRARGLLTRAGVDVTVTEKHDDFLRDFRGDAIRPSTLKVMDQLGYLEEFLALPHQNAPSFHAEIGGRLATIADFSGLPTRCKYIVRRHR